MTHFKNVTMNVETYNNLLKLFQEFRARENVTADEFIEEKLLSDTCPLSDDDSKMFVLLVTHRSFLEAIKNNFVTYHNLRNYNDIRLIMVLFIVLFASEESDLHKLFKLFKNVKCAFKRSVLQYFCDEDNLIQTALTGCKFFEDEYILNSIINPLLNRCDTLKKIDEYLYKDKLKKLKGKPPTVPDRVSVWQRIRNIPVVPLNTPMEVNLFRAKEVPKTLYQVDNIEKALAEKFEKNKEKARKLLEQAKALDKNYCKPKEPVDVYEAPAPVFKAKKAPRLKSSVDIKGNTAAVLREGNLLIKEQEKEIQSIEEILRGGFTLERYRDLEENARRIQEQKSIEDIERKHLQGLLTFEEAILAKKRLLECNKERFREFMEERDDFLKEMEDWREEEQERIKMLVKKGREIERNAKESEKKLKQEKKSRASRMKEDTKKMLEEACARQKAELLRKIKLIEEIKTLHQLNSLNVKKYDRCTCPDLGLLCQMSIADLQKKLAEVKLEMERQLEQKRRCIRKYKERQREMVEHVRNFITQTRMSKPKPTSLPIRTTKLAQSPELDRLRGRLEVARELRKSDGVLPVDRRTCSNKKI